MSGNEKNSNNLSQNNKQEKKSIIEKLKAIKTEDKIIIGVVAVIVIAIFGVWMSTALSSSMEKKHQAQLRVEANLPECVHIQEAEEELLEMKEHLKSVIKSDFDGYWKSYEQNFWKEFRKLHVQNHPDCFAAQNEE